MTNTELFRRYEILIVGNFVARMKEGEDTEELVSILIDIRDPELPEAVRDALEVEQGLGQEKGMARSMPFCSGARPALDHPPLHLGVALREELMLALADSHPDVAMALDQPTRLNRAPCVVVAGGELTLHHFVVQALRWVAGGDT